MYVRFWISVFLCQPKVNDVYHISKLASSHQEILRLDVAMDVRFAVDVFDPRDELVGKQQNGLQRELSVAKVEQVF